MAANLKVWAISLERAVERRTSIKNQLQDCCFPYSIMDGLDGNSRREEFLQDVDVPSFEKNMGREVLIGEIGCFLSHMAVWREFVVSGYEYALVLEDDIRLHDNFWDAVRTGLEISALWDFLKLNKVRAKFPVSQGSFNGYELNAYIGMATGTGAYIIKRDVAERLLNEMLPVKRATDHELARYYAHDLKLRGLEPFPSHTEDWNFSYIGGRNGEGVRKFPWYRRLPNLANRPVGDFLRFLYLLRTGGFSFHSKSDTKQVKLSADTTNAELDNGPK